MTKWFKVLRSEADAQLGGGGKTYPFPFLKKCFDFGKKGPNCSPFSCILNSKCSFKSILEEKAPVFFPTAPFFLVLIKKKFMKLP